MARASARSPAAALLLAASTVAAVSRAEETEQKSALPGVDEVLAGYTSNRDAFRTLHIIITERTKYTDDWAAWQTAQADRMEDYARGKDVPEAQRQPLLEQARNARLVATAAREEQWQTTEFFTDRRACQFRRPTAIPLPADWVFPKAALTAESLLAEFAGVYILSLAPEATPPVRIWQGAVRPGHPPYKLVSNKRLEQLGAYRFPPLGAASFDWTTAQTRGPVDEFFSGAAHEYHVLHYVVRPDAVEGQRLLVVERRTTFDQPTAIAQPDGSVKAGSVKSHRQARAWLDPARGWLPVRCEFRAAGEWGGKPVDPSDFPPYHVFEVTKVVAIDGAAFYPAAGEVQSMGPRADALPVTVLDLIERKVQEEDQVVHQIDRWDCSLIEANVTLPDALFLPEFPANAVVFDLDQNKTIGALEPRPPLGAGEAAPALDVAAWLDGESRTLADLRGRVVVLDFWGLWCGPCRQIVPGLKQLHEDYRDRPVTFISIHTAGVQPADAAAFLEQQEWECLAAIDAGTMIEDSATANLYGVRGFPTLVVIDSRGTVSYNSGHEPADREAFLAQMQSDAEDLGFPWPLDKDADADVRQERTTQMLVHAMRREIDRVLPPSD